MNKVKVTIFCGGRGSYTIIKELLKQDIDLVLIINAFDDGLSTGSLRKVFPDLLGPSDFRKNYSSFIDLHSLSQYALLDLVNYRINNFNVDYIKKFNAYLNNENMSFDKKIEILFSNIEKKKFDEIKKYLKVVLNDSRLIEHIGYFKECSLGNLLFTGLFLFYDNSFEKAQLEFGKLISSRIVILNASTNKNYFLIGITRDGVILQSEGEIVENSSKAALEDIFFIDHNIKDQFFNKIGSLSKDNKIDYIKKNMSTPDISKNASERIINSDIIIYGPGTQFSSLIPSYKICRKALSSSKAKLKLMIMNLKYDKDIRGLSAESIIDSCLNSFEINNLKQNAISHLFFNDSYLLEDNIKFANEENLINYKNIKIVKQDFTQIINKNVHSGYKVVKNVFEIWEKYNFPNLKNEILIYYNNKNKVDIIENFIEEIAEIEWNRKFNKVNLVLNKKDNIVYSNANLNWLKIYYYEDKNDKYDELEIIGKYKYLNCKYFISLTGEGNYRVYDAYAALNYMINLEFDILLGSRVQDFEKSKEQIKLIYKNKIINFLAISGNFILSLLFSIFYNKGFTDVLTGFKIYKLKNINGIIENKKINKIKTKIDFLKLLIKNKYIIGELPIRYKLDQNLIYNKKKFIGGFKNFISFFKIL